MTRLTTAALAVLLLMPAGPLAAQGPLIPPGAPAATMKTLAQIEPRTDVQKLSAAPPYTISSPGSYYLSANISVTSGNAIVIDADNVTLDLGGFAILSSPGNTTGTAISVLNDHRQLIVRNGNIGVTTGQTAGFQNGIYSGSTISQVLVTDLHVTQVSRIGIYLDQQGVVERCTFSGVGITAIVAEVARDCLALAADTAINVKTAVNCSGQSTGSGIGIKSLTATDSRGTSVSGTGLEAETATGCHGTSTSGFGLRALIATNCTGISTTSVGLGWDQTNLFDFAAFTNVATNCRGISSAANNAGLLARNATNCYAQSGGSCLYALVANGCTVAATSGKYGIFASIAIGCVVTGSGNLGTFAANKYNMP